LGDFSFGIRLKIRWRSGKAGINRVAGFSLDTRNGFPFVDPVSNIPVSFRQTNIVGGLNLFPDGLDVGIFAGESYSEIVSSP
jgi:hypothetical protein